MNRFNDFSKRAKNGRSLLLMDGNVRRLPPWMLAGASSGVTGTSNRKESDEGKRKLESPKKKTEKRPRRCINLDASEEAKKVETRGRRGIRSKNKEEEAKPSIGRDGKSHEIIQFVTGPEDEDLTVDDLLSFAQEYVKGEEDQTRNEKRSLSTSESTMDVDESKLISSQGNGTKDPTSEDMINLLLGPFFKKSQ